MLFQMPKRFTLPEGKELHFIIVGLGGTGGYLFPNLARLALNTEARKVHITLVDGDIIELKNVNRQNFFQPDVGKNKADLMATRHGRLFGSQYGLVQEYIEDEDHLKDVIYSIPDAVPCVVTCVDNHKTRLMIHDVFNDENEEPFIWLDSGNEEFTGQITMGYRSSKNIQSVADGANEMFRLPAITDIHPEILDVNRDELLFNSEESCVDNAVANIQNISANITAANILFNFSNMLISKEGCSVFKAYFNTKTSGVETFAITDNNVSEHISE